MNQELHSDGDEDNSELDMALEAAPKHIVAVDHEARRMAQAADFKATALADRMDRLDEDFKELKREIRDGFQQVKDSIGRVHSRIDRLLWGVLAGLAIIVAQIVLTKVGLL